MELVKVVLLILLHYIWLMIKCFAYMGGLIFLNTEMEFNLSPLAMLFLLVCCGVFLTVLETKELVQDVLNFEEE